MGLDNICFFVVKLKFDVRKNIEYEISVHVDSKSEKISTEFIQDETVSILILWPSHFNVTKQISFNFRDEAEHCFNIIT